MRKKIVVVHSGGMDSSICLSAAIREHGRDNVLSLSFDYCQRHNVELEHAKKICADWHVDHVAVEMRCLTQITQDALTGSAVEIEQGEEGPPTTLVLGRNGLMARLAAIHAHSLGAHQIYMGVIGIESQCSGYRDCSREYMDKMEEILRIDLDDPSFRIVTPVVEMTKKETLDFAQELGVRDYLLENTVTCYRGIPKAGCGACPACVLRNRGLQEYAAATPGFVLPYNPDLGL